MEFISNNQDKKRIQNFSSTFSFFVRHHASYLFVRTIFQYILFNISKQITIVTKWRCTIIIISATRKYQKNPYIFLQAVSDRRCINNNNNNEEMRKIFSKHIFQEEKNVFLCPSLQINKNINMYKELCMLTTHKAMYL